MCNGKCKYKDRESPFIESSVPQTMEGRIREIKDFFNGIKTKEQMEEILVRNGIGIIKPISEFNRETEELDSKKEILDGIKKDVEELFKFDYEMLGLSYNGDDLMLVQHLNKMYKSFIMAILDKERKL